MKCNQVYDELGEDMNEYTIK